MDAGVGRVVVAGVFLPCVMIGGEKGAKCLAGGV